MPSIFDEIQKQDMFAHQVKINYNDHSEKSVCGGCFSILVKILLVAYAIYIVTLAILTENNLNVQIYETYS